MQLSGKAHASSRGDVTLFTFVPPLPLTIDNPQPSRCLPSAPTVPRTCGCLIAKTHVDARVRFGKLMDETKGEMEGSLLEMKRCCSMV